jgi:hypothetical protein
MKGKWQVAVAPVVVVALVLIGAHLWRDSGEGNAEVTRLGSAGDGDRGHVVRYQVWAAGTANQPVQIGYAGPDGDDQDAEVPGFAPIWSETVTTDPDLRAVSLNAMGSSSDLAFTLTCKITVDDVEVVRESARSACLVRFELGNLAAAKARAAATPTPGVTTPAASAASTPGAPAACRYVTAAEMTTVVTSAAGTVKPVLSLSGDGRRCRQVVDQDASAVSFEVERDGRPGGLPATRVRSIRERAYYLPLGDTMGELRVSLPGGDVFVVEVFFLGLRADARQVAVDTYRAARARLLRER